MTTANRMTGVFLATRENVEYVYGLERQQEIRRRLNPASPCPLFDPAAIDTDGDKLREVDVVFSTWGMPLLTGDQLDRYLPNLKAVFYAAGSVQAFARPMLERGVIVVSAWRANAISVAQYTASQVLLAAKGYFRNLREYKGDDSTYRDAFRGRGAYGETVAVLGAGAIGRLLVPMLHGHDFKVIVWDPFLSDEAAEQLNVEKVDSLLEAFKRGYVVSNHLADKPATAGMLNRDLFASMRQNATFINTGRGRTVDQPALVAALRIQPDLTALLDVTYPEPPGAGSEIMSLPNAHITSHIAGTIGDEVHRMADLCIQEFDRFIGSEPLHHSVTLSDLSTMA